MVSWLCLASASFGNAGAARGQELPRVATSRKIAVAGVVAEHGREDLLGLSRVKFQGLIGSELMSAGYQLASPDEAAFSHGEGAPLTLTARVEEEICDDLAPSQCRVAITWSLEDARGVVVYRTLTRAFDQKPSIDELRRSLIRDALASLLRRRRFPLQITRGGAATAAAPAGPLGFRRCRRPTLELPSALRAAAASVVWVESGSHLASGAIISGDGLILTSANGLESGAPLGVRFAAGQKLKARVVAIERAADVALLEVEASTEATCLASREAAATSGTQVFGVSSEPSEDVAISLSGGALLATHEISDHVELGVPSTLAVVDGAPLLDERGRLVGVVSRRASRAAGEARAVEVGSALRALGLAPAAISDPRLVESGAPRPTVSAVRDADDPPFVLTKQYTFGTSSAARTLRTASLVTASLGALGVAVSWLSFRASPHPSAGEHRRAVLLNDASWGVLGLGALGVGASFAWPEAHELVAGRSAQRELFFGVTPRSVTLGAHL